MRRNGFNVSNIQTFDVSVFDCSRNKEINDSVKELFTEIAVREMRWPAEDLIADIVDGKRIYSQNFVAFKGKEIVGASKVSITRPFPVEIAFPEIISQIENDRQKGLVIEVALTAVRKEYRKDATVMLNIYRKLYQWSKSIGVFCWYGIQERQVTRLYRMIGFPFRELTDGKYYWCGQSYPCTLVIAEAEAYVSMKRKNLWNFFQNEV